MGGRLRWIETRTLPLLERAGIIREGDRITLVGTREDIDEVRSLFQRELPIHNRLDRALLNQLPDVNQVFGAALNSPGQARPGWKILRRLGEMMALAGFDFVDLGPVREAIEEMLVAKAAEKAKAS